MEALNQTAHLGYAGFYEWFFGALTLGFALIVLFSKNPVASALGLMGSLLCTGALYLGMGHFFSAVVQVLVYAGAIAVLFVFIVMLLELKPIPLLIPGRKLSISLAIFAGVLLFVALMGAVVLPSAQVALEAGYRTEIGSTASHTAEAISHRMLSRYMFAFQITGILILAAVMAAVVLGKPKRFQNKETKGTQP